MCSDLLEKNVTRSKVRQTALLPLISKRWYCHIGSNYVFKKGNFVKQLIQWMISALIEWHPSPVFCFVDELFYWNWLSVLLQPCATFLLLHKRKAGMTCFIIKPCTDFCWKKTNFYILYCSQLEANRWCGSHNYDSKSAMESNIKNC